MKFKIALSLMLMTSSLLANTYVTEKPKNIKQIVGVENLLELTEVLDSRIADVNNSSMMIKKLSLSSKTDFCMKVGALSSTMESYNKAFHGFIPKSAPYFMNKAQSELHQAANSIDYKIREELRSLEDYCSGKYNLDEEERGDIIGKIRDAYRENSLNVSIYGDDSSNGDDQHILAPMKTEDLVQQHKEEVKKKKLKECMLF